MNACASCKRGKRKCDKARPSCTNCLRLRRPCQYIEDTIETHFAVNARNSQSPLRLPDVRLADTLSNIDPSNQESIQQSTIKVTMSIIGSIDNMLAISNEFFTGTHQRIPALSKLRFQQDLQSFNVGSPRTDLAVLCLCILLIQQLPSEMTNLQSPLYIIIKHLVSLLELTTDVSLDFLHCTILLAYYEMGHGSHRAAYLSVAACARRARVLGLHRKRWRDIHASSNMLALEEEKRTWWTIVIMDRFINLCNGDALLVTEDPERTDPLPIEDLIWSEGSNPAALEELISAPLSLDTPYTTTVGQMARECQISHLVGRVVRHVFSPTADPQFNKEEAIQLERTLRSYIPLLATEELKIGKYCAAFGMCNSALFILYESMLSHNDLNAVEKRLLLQSMEDTSIRCMLFAEASYSDREQNYPPEILSPYLPYSLCQSAIVRYRIWRNTNDPDSRQHLDTFKSLLKEFTKRWAVARFYLEIIDNLDGSWPLVAVPFLGTFISTGKSSA